MFFGEFENCEFEDCNAIIDISAHWKFTFDCCFRILSSIKMKVGQVLVQLNSATKVAVVLHSSTVFGIVVLRTPSIAYSVKLI